MARTFPTKPDDENVIALLNLREAGERFGLTHWVIYRAVEQGQLRACKRGDGRIYYLETELKRLAGKSETNGRFSIDDQFPLAS